MRKPKSAELILCGLGIACVFIVTSFLAFPIGSFGYLNIGDAVILLFSSIVSPVSAFLIGAFGSLLADMMLAPQYMLFSFFIKGLEGAAAAYLLRTSWERFGYLAGGGIVLIGYAFADAVLSGQPILALTSAAVNFIQVGVCISIAYVGKPLLKKLRPD